MSCSATLVAMEFNNRKTNVLDTPGLTDFQG